MCIYIQLRNLDLVVSPFQAIGRLCDILGVIRFRANYATVLIYREEYERDSVAGPQRAHAHSSD